MSTSSYLIAQQIIPKIKAQCPHLVVTTNHAGRPVKNSFTFFAGSERERTIQFRRMMAQVNPFWRPSDYDPMLRDWGGRINVQWLKNTYTDILSREIYVSMGMPEDTNRYYLEENLSEITGCTLQIAKAQIWGIPVNLRHESWFFHRLIVGCAKKTVPEEVWKLSCINAGNCYGINESVLMDAILEQKAYQSLYAIHPLLGRSYVPWIRSFVERSIGDYVDHLRYAKQLQSALDAYGIHKSGMKTLHRMAESSPMTFRDVMRRVVGHTAESSEEIIHLLNLLNGQKPSSSITFKHVIEKTMDNTEAPSRHPEDILTMVRLDQWLAKDMRFDRGLTLDWMRFLMRERRGSLHRGYLDVTKHLNSPAKRKEAALAWANRSQRYWHRHRPAPEAVRPYSMKQSLSWKPILNDSVFSLDEKCGAWTFVELTSSEALREEGDLMRHCVGGYDEHCYYSQSHIFSVRDKNGDRNSTLELRPKYTGTRGRKPLQYVIAQNRGEENEDISIACRRASEQFLKTVNHLLKSRHPIHD